MENSNYDENKIKEAKEKLACHIVPPSERKPHGGDAADGGSGGASGGQTDFIDERGRVHLTQMTAAGG